MPTIPHFDSFNESASSGLRGLGHAQGRYTLRLQGERPVQVHSTIFCDDGSVLLMIRPTSSDDLDLFATNGYLAKLERYVAENLGKGVVPVKDHERGGALFEFTDSYFQSTLDHLF